MKISQMIAALQEIADKQGDLDVLASADNGYVYEVMDVSSVTAEEGDYPDDWNMPAGYTFVSLYL